MTVQSGEANGRSRKLLLLILAALVVLAGVGGFRYAVYVHSLGDKQAALEQEAAATPPPLIAVHIIGAVREPGLYWLKADSRVVDALDAAGGAKDEADLLLINLAAFVRDGSQLVVPYVAAAPPAVAAAGEGTEPSATDAAQAQAQAEAEKINAIFAASAVANSGGSVAPTVSAAATPEPAAAVAAVININTANSAQLQTLSGIGEVKAQAIIDYRQTNGDFAAIEHITRVSGIGQATFDKIKDRICVD